MIIYKVTNKINGKVYIGQTIRTLNERKRDHLYYAQFDEGIQFHYAIRKYGASSFKWEVVCEAKDKETLNELERYYIQKYDSINTGYNMVDGGGNNVMFIPEIKEKHRLKMQSEETRKKISDTMKKKYKEGKLFTEEHKRNLSLAMKGNNNFGDNHDTRSVACYCITESGERYDFPNYLTAGKWLYDKYRQFPYSESLYQHKIKQSIEYAFYTYGRLKDKKFFEYPKWYRKDGAVNEEVTN